MKKTFLFFICLVLLASGCANKKTTEYNVSVILDETPPSKNVTAEVGVEIGQLAPDFMVTTFDGKQIRLSSLRGQAVMIDFWAKWCPYCRTEFPEMQKAHKTYKDKGLTILAIHRTATESLAQGESFIDEMNVDFLVASDTNDELYKLYTKGLRAMPSSVFIDRTGVIQSRILGPKNLETFKKELDKIL